PSRSALPAVSSCAASTARSGRSSQNDGHRTFSCLAACGRRQPAPMARSTTDAQAAFRLLPAIDEVMRDPRSAPLVERAGRELVQSFAAQVIEAWRAEIRAEKLAATAIERRIERGELFSAIAERVRREQQRGVVR